LVGRFAGRFTMVAKVKGTTLWLAMAVPGSASRRRFGRDAT